DVTGNLFIADAGNNRIRKVSLNGFITTFAGTGAKGSAGDGGPAVAAEINAPQSLAFDGGGNLSVAEASGHRIRKITPARIISTIAGMGAGGYNGDGRPAISATLNLPLSVSVDAEGNLLIADYLNNRIRNATTAGTIT